MGYVLIKTRDGVSAERLRDWIERYFQVPLDEDGVEPRYRRVVGNPLVNATVMVIEDEDVTIEGEDEFSTERG